MPVCDTRCNINGRKTATSEILRRTRRLMSYDDFQLSWLTKTPDGTPLLALFQSRAGTLVEPPTFPSKMCTHTKKGKLSF